MDIQKELFKMQELKMKDFNSKLIPNIEKENFIGIRTPKLRKFAKEIYKNNKDEVDTFLNSLPHKYIEENFLHGFLIDNLKDFDDTLKHTEKFLPFIDNWANCDSFNPKIFKKNKEKIYEKIKIWIKSNHEYTVRYAIGLLLSNYLDEDFKEEHLEMVVNIKRDEYYIKMMVAWYFSFALIKQYESTIPYIQQKKLEKWTHNKTIQKAVESFRIDNETKKYLKLLKLNKRHKKRG